LNTNEYPLFFISKSFCDCGAMRSSLRREAGLRDVLNGMHAFVLKNIQAIKVISMSHSTASDARRRQAVELRAGFWIGRLMIVNYYRSVTFALRCHVLRYPKLK
jgi:hypothetical protein